MRGNYLAQFYLTTSRKIHILLQMTHPAYREAMWRKEALCLFIDPENQ